MGTVEGHVNRVKQVCFGLVREMRPWQWYKQTLLLVGIVFSKNVLNVAMWHRIIVSVIAFCAIAGAIYIFNDILDVEEDRNHPKKRHRPIASGQVDVHTASVYGVGLFGVALVLAYSINILFLAVVGAYALQNLIYSTYLKDVILVDVLVIAIGFVLRAIGGVVAIEVYLSPWLVVCTFLAALLLAIGKRRQELQTVRSSATTRQTLTEYTEETLNQLLVVVMSTLLLSYSLYTFFRADNWMMLTLPFAFFGVFRYHHLTLTTEIGERPLSLLFDRPFILNMVVWIALMVAVLYDVPELLAGVIQ